MLVTARDPDVLEKRSSKAETTAGAEPPIRQSLVIKTAPAHRRR
jgi:hypothetical protein